MSIQDWLILGILLLALVIQFALYALGLRRHVGPLKRRLAQLAVRATDRPDRTPDMSARLAIDQHVRKVDTQHDLLMRIDWPLLPIRFLRHVPGGGFVDLPDVRSFLADIDAGARRGNHRRLNPMARLGDGIFYRIDAAGTLRLVFARGSADGSRLQDEPAVHLDVLELEPLLRALRACIDTDDHMREEA